MIHLKIHTLTDQLDKDSKRIDWYLEKETMSRIAILQGPSWQSVFLKLTDR